MAKFHRPRVASHKNKNQGLEQLENRQLFAVSLGSDGWTDITPSSDSRLIYVSNSGSDSNNGLSSASPVKTISKAKSLLRSGSPDWMLLKRGDAWSENLSGWNKSGRNDEEPMVIGAYGSGERPTLNTGTGIGFKNSGAVSHLSIMGIEFHANSRDTESSSYNGTTSGNYGFHTMGNLDDILIEDTVFDDYTYNMSVTAYDGEITDFRLRRSIITDAWSTTGKAQGMYVDEVNGLLLEDNVFDHNGWNTDVSGAGATMYSHGVYMSARNDNVVIRGNVFADSSSHGLMARAGGVIEDNLFLRNPINMTFGGGASVTAGGVSGRVKGNVILDSRDINGSKRGMGIEIANTKVGADVVVSDNIISGDTTQRNMPAITFNTNSDASNVSQAVGLNDLTIKDNIVYDWYSAWNLSSSFKLGGTGNNAVNDLKVQDNDFQQTTNSKLVKLATGSNNSEVSFSGNRYADDSTSSGWFQVGSTTTSFDKWKSSVESTAQSTSAGYTDPGRSISDYVSSIGKSGGLSTFLDGARDQERTDYDGKFSAAAVINYVRKGYAESGVVPGGLESVPGSGGDTTPDEPTPTPGGGGSTPGEVSDTSAPTVPGTVRATGASSTTVGITWDASSDNVGVTGYQIYRDGVKIATVTGTSWTDTGLTSGTAYVYKMKAVDAAGNISASSNNDTGTTLSADGKPTTPANLVASKQSNRTVKLTWSDRSTNESGFDVYTSTNGSTWTKLGTVATKSGSGSTVSYTTGSFSAGTRYFRVSAYNSTGESAPTSSVKVTL